MQTSALLISKIVYSFKLLDQIVLTYLKGYRQLHNVTYTYRHFYSCLIALITYALQICFDCYVSQFSKIVILISQSGFIIKFMVSALKFSQNNVYLCSLDGKPQLLSALCYVFYQRNCYHISVIFFFNLQGIFAFSFKEIPIDKIS